MVSFNSLQEWLTWQEGFYPQVIELGLERSASVYRKLHNTHAKPITLTVAGTNGKGSCVAFLEAIYHQQGYKVGAYTSPHILAYNERIKINRCEVSDEQICTAFARIEQVRGNTKLSYFEFGTLAALDIFQQQQVDVQILEVGLGGRLDAVNIIDTDAAIITNISIDHENFLGSTREEIGLEKAGIVRKDTPAIIGDNFPPDSLINFARKTGARISKINKDFIIDIHKNHWHWHSTEADFAQLPYPALQGHHQFDNAASALQAIQLLNARLPVSRPAIDKGIRTACLLGRFQAIEDGDTNILLDVGHNPQAAHTLLQFLQNNHADKRMHAIFAMMRDKDYARVIKILQPIITHWYLPPLQTPRAQTPKALKACFVQQGIQSVQSNFKDLKNCYSTVRQASSSGDLIVIFGSFYLVSEFLSLSRTDH